MKHNSREQSNSVLTRRDKVLIAAAVIFFVAFFVRSVISLNYDYQSRQVMTVLTDIYKMDARNLASGDWRTFLEGPNPPVDAHILSHPPGYPVFLAAVFRTFGESDTAIKLFQTTGDALAAVLVFLLALQFFSYESAVAGGLFAAFSPQLSIHSQSLLPESLSVLPIIAALLLTSIFLKKQKLWMMVGAGILIGISCWLRSTSLLLAPFLGIVVLLISGRKSILPVLLLIVSTCLTVAPISIRNFIVFDKFIPLSLGTGVTLIGGLADYDREGRFNLPRSDVEVAHTEAVEFGVPEYAGSLYNPDGILRETYRLERGLTIVRENPGWFAGVMIRRAFSMLEPERVPVVAPSVAFDEESPGWARFLGGIIWWPQKIIYSPAMLLLLILSGLILAVFRSVDRRWLILLTVPAYALIVQSALHTEPRYTVGIWYFLLIFAGVAVGYGWERVIRRPISVDGKTANAF